jgi:putative methylase
MKLRALEIKLQSFEVLKDPREDLEQYQTPATMAARLLYIALGNDDVAGRRVLDPGCGNGCLGIGAALLGARSVTCMDVDPRMVELARSNIQKVPPGIAENVRIVERSVIDELTKKGRSAAVNGVEEETSWDTVIMNPPFGAQSRGADRPFLRLAFERADSIYSIHRMGTRDFVEKASKGAGFTVDWREDDSFPIPHMFHFHTRERENVGVTLFRLIRDRPD